MICGLFGNASLFIWWITVLELTLPAPLPSSFLSHFSIQIKTFAPGRGGQKHSWRLCDRGAVHRWRWESGHQKSNQSFSSIAFLVLHHMYMPCTATVKFNRENDEPWKAQICYVSSICFPFGHTPLVCDWLVISPSSLLSMYRLEGLDDQYPSKLRVWAKEGNSDWTSLSQWCRQPLRCMNQTYHIPSHWLLHDTSTYLPHPFLHHFSQLPHPPPANMLLPLQVIRKVVRRVFSSEERRQSEGEFIAAEEPAAAAGGGGVGGDVASGGADTASSSGAAARATGGKSKKKGKRSRHGHKEEPQRVKAEVAVETNCLT